MSTLFNDPSSPPPTGDEPIVAIAVAANVWDTYDYLWPPGQQPPQRGVRVHVPLGRGNRRTLGFVTEIDRPRAAETKYKHVADVIDEHARFTPELWRLGLWISEYYLSPLGQTLAAMLPSAVGKHARRREAVVTLTSQPGDWPTSLGSKQRRLLDELLEARRQGVEPLAMDQLLAHAQAGRDSLRRLAERGLIRTDTRPVELPDLSDNGQGDPFELNADQQGALAQIRPKLNAGFSATLLHGVTGSGKTEVYVRAIREVVEAGRQAIVLVPEIALASQTFQRLVQRLPRVAVLHSGLTAPQRDFYWRHIAEGHAAVVIGPRSAIFAPTPRLGLVIVDEEHEGSYKQETVPRYHGRDVAVKRASIEAVPVVLGSATPSLESFHNARQGKYGCISLPRRVRGLPMPRLKVVSLRDEIRPGRIELIGETLTARMAATLDRNRQVILLLNRRGYASYVFCPSCQWLMTCEHCTRAMVFHQAVRQTVCHYCDYAATLPEHCPACRGKIVLFGLGIQRVEDELFRKFPDARVARMDSDTMTSPAQFQKVFDAFAVGEIDILLGTQMVAKGLDFPRIGLVGVVSGDTSLSMPDFRASERTFQLIVQVAGRAGRADEPGEVVVQTLQPEQPAIALAVQHDYEAFAAMELPSRMETQLPPATRMVRFVLRGRTMEQAEESADVLARRLGPALSGSAVRVIGPQQAAVAKIRDHFRFHLLVVTDRPGELQRRIWPRMGQWVREVNSELACDVDPLFLL